MAPPPTSDKELKRRAKVFVRCGYNQTRAADELGISRPALQDSLRRAEKKGFIPPPPSIEKEERPPSPFAIEQAPQVASVDGAKWILKSTKDNRFVFGAMGDLHAGSKYTRWEVREDLMKRAVSAGATCIFDTGNWIDGEKSFNRYDLETVGLDNQVNLLAKHYPKVGIPTYAVTGDDHEGWYIRSEGIDVGRYCESVMRDSGHDWINLGYMEADIVLQNANSGIVSILRVVHPGGGSAYATSYRPQKIIESYEGGEKPAVVLFGHYHKLDCNNIRNVWAVQTGCFLAGTSIETDRGAVKIKDIKIGDMVRTHRNRYRRVTRLFKRKHEGDLVSINYGRVGRSDQTITATPEHPFLVEREGSKKWIQIADIVPGDMIFVQAKKCAAFGDPIPYWMRLSNKANPMDIDAVRNKLSATRGGKEYTRGGSCGASHLINDVIPYCEQLKADGWQVVPVGAGVIPDAIGFKDGKVVAFEIEKSTGRLREFKESKYDASPIMGYIDRVEWISKSERVIQPRSWYEFDEETGLCKVLVVGVKRGPVKGAHNRRSVSVYNFAVEEDESYMAGRVAVHNCSQDQTPFMRKKSLEAHVGGAIIELEQDPKTGAIVGFKPDLRRYFNRAYYVAEGKANDRWSGSGGVKMIPRRIGSR